MNENTKNLQQGAEINTPDPKGYQETDLVSVMRFQGQRSHPGAEFWHGAGVVMLIERKGVNGAFQDRIFTYSTDGPHGEIYDAMVAYTLDKRDTLPVEEFAVRLKLAMNPMGADISRDIPAVFSCTVRLFGDMLVTGDNTPAGTLRQIGIFGNDRRTLRLVFNDEAVYLDGLLNTMKSEELIPKLRLLLDYENNRDVRKVFETP